MKETDSSAGTLRDQIVERLSVVITDPKVSEEGVADDIMALMASAGTEGPGLRAVVESVVDDLRYVKAHFHDTLRPMLSSILSVLEEAIAARPVEAHAEAGETVSDLNYIEDGLIDAGWTIEDWTNPEKGVTRLEAIMAALAKALTLPAASTEGLREAATWVQHLLHGQSKDGSNHISDEEWKDAIDALDAALRGEGK